MYIFLCTVYNLHTSFQTLHMAYIHLPEIIFTSRLKFLTCSKSCVSHYDTVLFREQ